MRMLLRRQQPTLQKEKADAEAAAKAQAEKENADAEAAAKAQADAEKLLIKKKPKKERLA
jgi:hypothetical protein